MDDLGPVSAIRWLVDQINNDGDIEASLILVDDYHRQLTGNISTHLFRIAHEALSNVRRHSEATQVVITMKFNPETVGLIIEDNGKGFSIQDINRISARGKLAINGMQERVRLLNGIMKNDSKNGKVTTISVGFKD